MKCLLARQAIVIIALIFTVQTVPIRAAESTSASVLVPAGTTVTLVPDGTGGMADIHNAGDEISFKVKDAVIIDGWVVIPKDAPAHGTISSLTSAGIGSAFAPRYQAASLHFAFAWVQLVSGRLRLDDAPVEVKGRQIKREGSAGLFGAKRKTQEGADPFLTAQEYGVGATTVSTVHVTSKLRATALEQASQKGDYITK